MVSLFLVFTAFVISNVGHIRPQRTLLAFVSGIFFILSGEGPSLPPTAPGEPPGPPDLPQHPHISPQDPHIPPPQALTEGLGYFYLYFYFFFLGGGVSPTGLSLVVGLVLYISSINDEVMNRPSGSEQYFQYRYGWSFAFAASSFLLKEVRRLARPSHATLARHPPRSSHVPRTLRRPPYTPSRELRGSLVRRPWHGDGGTGRGLHARVGRGDAAARRGAARNPLASRHAVTQDCTALHALARHCTPSHALVTHRCEPSRSFARPR